MDAVIIFLLAVQASMIFPALNWWRHPVRWFRSLDSTEKFTFVVAVFTAVLALATCVQVWAFIQSERAFLVVDNPRFRTGEPTADRPDLIMTLKNPGKKVAAVQEFIATYQLGLHAQELHEETQNKYNKTDFGKSLVAPGNEITISGNLANGKAIFTEQVINDLLRGEDSFYIFGDIKYYDGYNIFEPSEIGYCFSYLPPNQREVDTFAVCKDPKYTYAR